MLALLSSLGYDNYFFKDIDWILEEKDETHRFIDIKKTRIARFMLDDSVEFWIKAKKEKNGMYSIKQCDLVCINDWKEVKKIKKVPNYYEGEYIASVEIDGLNRSLLVRLSNFIPQKILKKENYLISFSFFSYDIHVYKDMTDYDNEYGHIPIIGIASQGSILDEGKDKFTNIQLVSGIINNFERRVNTKTNKPYYKASASIGDIDVPIYFSEDDIDVSHLRVGSPFLATVSACGRIINKNNGDVFECAEPKKYLWKAKDNEESFDKEIASHIGKMRDMTNDFLIVDFNKDTIVGDIGFIQAIKQGHNYYVEVGLYGKESRITERMYRLPDIPLKDAVNCFYKLCVEKSKPDLSKWEDVTEEIFGQKEEDKND